MRPANAIYPSKGAVHKEMATPSKHGCVKARPSISLAKQSLAEALRDTRKLTQNSRICGTTRKNNSAAKPPLANKASASIALGSKSSAATENHGGE